MTEFDEDKRKKEMQQSMRRFTRSAALPRGAILLYALTQLPEYWLWCNGAEIERQKYAKLFEAIGTQFGAGDGQTTFNLPNIPDLAPGIRYIIKVLGQSED